MALEKELTSGRRFGSRYGRRMRHKFSKVEAEQRKSHKCPYCSDDKVKRVSAGIWNCKKCGSVFTGRAYTVPKKIVLKEEVKKEVIEEVEEEKTKKKKEEKPKKYKENKKEAVKEEKEELKEE
ncbi:50S ribosomal protein L37ae [Candidatus Woesearchaeota archaeon]|nr:50S ribosomal protein L37ae [Candidatus Woesearchaeota archaeon]